MMGLSPLTQHCAKGISVELSRSYGAWEVLTDARSGGSGIQDREPPTLGVLREAVSMLGCYVWAV
jgi:hypothetical protein